MSRATLQRLGIELPLLPTATVGSLPKPPALVAARAQFARGALSQRELDELAAEAVLYWLERQEQLGLDVLVDGEMYRGDMVGYFANALDGMELGGLVRSYGNRYYHKPVITGPVRWQQPITVGWWQFAQRHSKRPVKAIVTGPYTMMDWSFNEHYPDRRAACLALAAEIRKEVAALVHAGARIVQIDEPALSARPPELPLAIAANRLVTDGLDAYFITHACYGAFDTIYPGMLALPTENLDFASSQSAVDWRALFQRPRVTKDLSLGVLDVHSRVIEGSDEVHARIERARPLVNAQALWVTPDCGLKTRTAAEANAKLSVMVEATAKARATLPDPAP
ncbi:MAG: methionine synthase [Deltaproteobacteria bacterium]|nr:methionine synthase [Deltaproteobacteria bacterium]